MTQSLEALAQAVQACIHCRPAIRKFDGVQLRLGECNAVAAWIQSLPTLSFTEEVLDGFSANGVPSTHLELFCGGIDVPESQRPCSHFAGVQAEIPTNTPTIPTEIKTIRSPFGERVRRIGRAAGLWD
jgi:hypothetical protein